MKKAALAVLIACALMAVGSVPASAGQFGELLIELETSVFYSAQSDEWRGRRDAWINEVRSAGDNLAALKRLLIEFETHLKYSAQTMTWRSRRSRWLQDVKGAVNLRALAQQMIACETALSYSSQAAAWRSRRSGWLNRARAVN